MSRGVVLKPESCIEIQFRLVSGLDQQMNAELTSRQRRDTSSHRSLSGLREGGAALCCGQSGIPIIIADDCLSITYVNLDRLASSFLGA